MKRPAVFLDRDGTIIENREYIADPDDVRLLPGSAEALRRFADAGYRLVIASNQSGIARGLFDEAALDAVHARLEELLADEGATLDGAYYCPYLDGPEATVKKYRRDSELRKPKPGMLLQAARELNIDLRRSWMIGDSPADVEAGARAGCQTVLLNLDPRDLDNTAANATHMALDLTEATGLVLKDMEQNRHKQSAPDPASRDDDVLRALEKIHDVLDRAQRPKRQDDFSFLRLLAALLQMFAIVTVLCGASALLDENAGMAAARFVLACFLQIASISAFAIDRFR